MASNSILLLCIFLVVATKVFSYDEDLKTVKYGILVQVPAPAPPVKAPTLAPPVKSPSYPPGPVTTPTVPTPTVKVPPPPQSPVVKPPTPTVPPPTVKVPPPPQSPVVKPPTPTPTSPVVYPPPVAPSPPAPVVKSNKDCIPLCDYRCSLHSRKKLCMRACITCCDRCKCVPPGTYGNREKCGKCYTDMLTHGNKFKCP
ncbi:hypothetical protein AAZX31_19G012200 [Glycine max]|uniref:Gibberellin-regulated protein 33 n=1 Tax=Glycine max TaxID=3847 RepID=I1N5W9_SOYBN